MDIEEPSPNPQLAPYNIIGGETQVRGLVNRFYDLMDEDPDYFGIRKLHPASLEGSRQKLFMFLSGWLGGPQLYVNEFGHPRLRARHLHVGIGMSERDQWMACMVRAMVDVGIEAGMRERLETSFMQTADWMRNKET